MATPGPHPFSWRWATASALIFAAGQVVLGHFVSGLIVGSMVSLHTRFLTEAIFILASYFIGGIIIGLISPGIRILEPAIGAFICVAMMFVVTVFTPLRFISFSWPKLLIGGAIAFALALSGAKIGERLAGNRLPQL